jgi:hypothetical protein
VEGVRGGMLRVWMYGVGFRAVRFVLSHGGIMGEVDAKAKDTDRGNSAFVIRTSFNVGEEGSFPH